MKSPGSKPIVQNGLPSLRSPERPCPSRPNLSPAPDLTEAPEQQFHAPTSGSAASLALLAQSRSAARLPLGLADDLVGEEREPVTDLPGVEEAHALLIVGLLEQALACPERDRVDHQP
jgi:hypothetical protein